MRATNDSSIEAADAERDDLRRQSVGIELAFNTIGWKRTNLLFAALDALLGDPFVSTAFGGSAAGADGGLDHELDDRPSAGDVT